MSARRPDLGQAVVAVSLPNRPPEYAFGREELLLDLSHQGPFELQRLEPDGKGESKTAATLTVSGNTPAERAQSLLDLLKSEGKKTFPGWIDD